MAKITPVFLDVEDEADVDTVWQALISKVQDIGQVLLACVFGSQRYNLHTSDSDVDMFVVYAANTSHILGLDPPPATIKNRPSDKHDFTVYEVHRYCELLVRGDPCCVETLFLHQSSIYYESNEWRELLPFQKQFLTRQCLEKYLGQSCGAKSKIDKWKASHKEEMMPTPDIAKKYYILIRILQNASRVPSGELQVFRPTDSSEWTLLHQIRHQELDLATLESLASSLNDEIMKIRQAMPDDKEHRKTQKKKVEDWILKLRFQNFKTFME